MKFLVTLSLALAIPVASAQQSTDTIRVDVDLVQTPITVLDKDGHFVDGLTRDQFEVLLDGKAKPITAFERILAAGPRDAALAVRDGAPATNPGRTSATTLGRTVVFFVDDLHMGAEPMDRTREILRHFIDTEVNPADSAAIVSASGQIGFLQQFSNNKEVLRSAVDRLLPRPYDVRGFATGQTVMSEYLALGIETNRGDKKVLDVFIDECLAQSPNFRGQNRQANRLNCEIDVKANARAILMQAGNITRNTYVSFDSLLRTLSRRSGRKIVYFISDGFLMDVGPRGPNLREQLDYLIASANRMGIVVNTIHSKGLNAGTLDASVKLPVDANGRLESARSGDIAATQDALNALAGDTGGRALRNQNYFDRFIETTLNEASNYYLLGWRLEADEGAPSKLLKLKVNILGKPELTVRAPTGYLDTTAAPKTVTRKSPDAELNDALGESTSLTGLPLQLSLTYLNTPNNEMLLTPWMQVASSNLNYGNNGQEAATIRLAGVVLDSKGKVAASFKNQLSVNPLSGSTTDSSGITYSHPTPVPAGTYEVRVAARDEKSGRIGSAMQWIVLPDLTKKQLTLSSLLLGAQVIENKKEDSPQIQLSVDHRFSRSGSLGFWAFAYNAKSDVSNATNVTVQTQILRAGQPAMPAVQRKLVNAATDASGMPFGETIALKELTPGPYQLRVTITDNQAGSTTTQTVEFDVGQ